MCMICSIFFFLLLLLFCLTPSFVLCSTFSFVAQQLMYIAESEKCQPFKMAFIMFLFLVEILISPVLWCISQRIIIRPGLPVINAH